MIVVAGGKGGVGTTTMALRLAAALEAAPFADRLGRCGPGRQCGHPLRHRAPHSLAEVLCRTCTVAEAIQPGPGGLRVLPGVWGWDGADDAGAVGADRLFAQLAALGSTTEWSCSMPEAIPAAWPSGAGAAERRLVVTTPETAAVMETYTLIKRLAQPSRQGRSTCW